MADDAAALKRGEKLFRLDCDFATGASAAASIPPPTVGEVAFAGRSNVGKSSLINALTFRKKLARASNTPGRTQQINFFHLGEVAFLVDLPGYGYAVASKTKVHAWNAMVQGYLRGRPTLKCVCVLVDSRHGLKDIDIDTMHMLDKSGMTYVVVLTKADKVKQSGLDEVCLNVTEFLKDHPLAHPQPLLTSADDKTGIPELRAFIAASLNF